jgi:hypothetical protein
LIDDNLDLSQMDASRLAPMKEHINFGGIVEDRFFSQDSHRKWGLVIVV